ncbi:MAG: hypothetical protein BWY92_00331 [Firmicutes bacterium ADurb.BinA052]|nr:MAG: hypothetical protein BWY92_00331 [Firmicutes bacterium ADurb.BinA052]
MRLLLHSCCAPCTTFCLKALRADGHEVSGYFFNPNIHPYTEFRRRLDTFREYCSSQGYSAAIDETYGLRHFLSEVGQDIEGRCAQCYRMRLYAAAELARKLGADAFTTTLLISPYQNHELLRRVADQAAEAAGVPFAYYDFRPGYRESVRLSREMGLYRQPYCGCIFSEEERYSPARR